MKAKILASGLTSPELVRTAWASAATFRGTDKRGGANGARIRLAPENDWPVNDPPELSKVLARLESIQNDFNKSASGGKKVSLADLIVLGGGAAVEAAAKKAGYAVEVPFTPGRTDAVQAQTDLVSFAALEPTADGFRDYYGGSGAHQKSPAEMLGSPTEMLVDRAALLTLTVPEMTVLVGGMRVLNANTGQTATGVFTSRLGALTTDFFVNLLDMSTKWSKSPTTEGLYEGRDRKTDTLKWTATPVDLVFGSNSQPARRRGGLCLVRRTREVRARFREGLDQGDEPRSFRCENSRNDVKFLLRIQWEQVMVDLSHVAVGSMTSRRQRPSTIRFLVLSALHRCMSIPLGVESMAKMGRQYSACWAPTINNPLLSVMAAW